MPTRTTVRVAASVFLVTVAVAGAAALARRAQHHRAPPASERGVEEPLAAQRTGDDARRPRRRVGLVLPDPVPDGSDDEHAAPRDTVVADTTTDAVDAPSDAAAESLQDELRRQGGGVHLVDARALVAGATLRARLDGDESSDDVAPVTSGTPDALAYATFVAAGPRAVADAAEIVGERRPTVEQGVPVALAGRVLRDEDGQPLRDATVVVSSTFYVRTLFYDHHLREVARAVTDAGGAWSVERLNADPVHFGRDGRVYVTVLAEGRAPLLAVPLGDVTPGFANRLPDVRLAAATETLHGRVLDWRRHEPVVGARIVATGTIDPVRYPKDEREALFVGAPSAVTDADGRFELTGLGRGVQTLSAHGGDDCIGTLVVALPETREATLVTRPIRGRIEGRVEDAAGAPVPLVLVDCGENSTHSFADGRFVLENFGDDVVRVTFEHADYRTVALDAVRDGTSGLLVRLEDARPLLVLDVRRTRDDAPVDRIRAEYRFADGSREPLPGSPFDTAPKGTGRHALRVPHGAVALRVTAPRLAGETLDLAGRSDGEVVALLLRDAASDAGGSGD